MTVEHKLFKLINIGLLYPCIYIITNHLQITLNQSTCTTIRITSKMHLKAVKKELISIKSVQFVHFRSKYNCSLMSKNFHKIKWTCRIHLTSCHEFEMLFGANNLSFAIDSEILIFVHLILTFVSNYKGCFKRQKTAGKPPPEIAYFWT